jgi:pantothenate kinase
MRKITLKIENEKTTESISSTITINDVNELYNMHGINAITTLLIQLNKEFNRKTGENIEISIPDPIGILPEGRKW